MNAGLRLLVLLGLLFTLANHDLLAQAALIKGWRNPDLIYCSLEKSDTIRGDSPPGKPFYIDGISYVTSSALTKLSDGVAILFPSRLSLGNHTIIYGTIGSHDVTVVITIQNMAVVSLAPYSNVCANALAYSLFNSDSSNVNPKNGSFSGPGVDASGFFDPTVAGPGFHTITYTVGLGGCASSATRTITVLPAPTAGINPFQPVCEGSPVILLTQGYPTGGIYSGPGVDASGNFNQAVTGVGSFPITYSYSNGTCSNAATRDIVVASNPVATFSGLESQYCTDDAGVSLTGSPMGVTGKFNGPGITDNGNGTALFEPDAAGLGLHQVSYTYTSVNGCVDTANQNVQVGTNVVLSGLASSYCINSPNITISGTPAGGTFGPLSGLTDHGNGTALFSPASAGTGIHTVSYTFIDGNGCINTRTRQVRVYALPVPSILNLAPAYCANASQITISGNYAPSGTFSGAATIDNGNGTAGFTPANLLPGGPYNVTYTYHDLTSGCQASVTNQVLINTIPTATLSGDASVCYGDPATINLALTGSGPFNISYTDGTGTYSVNNVAGPLYSVQVYPVDTTIYRMSVVSDSKGCSSAGTGDATINVLPEVSISTQPVSQTVCLGVNVQLRVVAYGANLQYQWEKDGVAVAGATNSVLAINNAQPADIGAYHCRVTGVCGPAITSNDALLQLWSPTVLVSDPVNAHECEGENINMTVQAIGSNLVFQWFKNNLPLQDTSNYHGSSTNTLFISLLSSTNAGNYHATVTGSCGTVASNPSILIIDRSILIATQPADVEICETGNATFSVTATGDNLSYQWQLNNMDIPGEMTPTLSVPNISVADEGFYRCHIQSTCGLEIFSDAAHLDVLSMAEVQSNPVSIIRCEGDNAVFSITASGTSLSYQWQKNGVNLIDHGKISGSTSASLVIDLVDETDIGSYSCAIANPCNQLVSNPATLSVDTSLAVTSQPVSVHACVGTNVFFRITASGNNVSYQWYKNGTIIPGETSATIVLNNIGQTHVAQYACNISNTCGKSITSIPAALSIDDPTAILQSPVDLETCVGNNALFNIQATGTGITYQWEFNGAPIVDGGQISGTQTNTLIIQQTEESNEGVYNCLVTGICGSERSIPASLIVNDRLGIIAQPLNLTVCEGNNAQFQTSVTGAVHYQWQKDETDLPGKNNPTLILNNVTAIDSGVYRCLLYSLCDTLSTDGASLHVKTFPRVILQPTAENICEGQQAQFESTASGSDISWHWMKDGSDLSDGSGYSGTTTHACIISPVEVSDAGVFSARIDGSCGSITTLTALLSVTPAPQIIAQPQSVITCENLSASFAVVASGTVTFQWQKDNVNLPGKTTATLTIANVSTSDIGVYSCKITGACGDLFTNGALLTVNSNVSIAQHPSDLIRCEDDIASLQVVASGTGLTYQWKHNGISLLDDTKVSGSTSSGLIINPVGSGDAGIYHCVITGTCGSVTSAAAEIEVRELITINSQPGSITTCLGQTASFNIQATGSEISWQWQKDGIDIPGAIGVNYSITSVTQADTGVYRCVLKGPCGQVFSEGAKLTIDIPPSVLVQPPLSINICQGNTISVKIAAQGSNLSYQWHFNGTSLSDNGSVSGAQTSWLEINPAAEANEGTYYCVVTNSCSSVVSSGTQVWVNKPAVITEQPKNTNTCSGEDISLTLSASGDGLTYQWQKASAIIAGATQPVLTINNIALADSGTYQCIITSVCGSSNSNAARVSVEAPWSVTSYPPSLLTPCEGTMVTLSVDGSGNTSTVFQWKRNGVPLTNTARIAGSQSPSLQISQLITGDDGMYTCEISNSCNTVTTPVTQIDVQTIPVVLFHPADYSVLNSGDATFSVTATGDGLTYQWYFNGTPLSNGGVISGATTSALLLTGVSMANQGSYNAVVSGTCGIATSQPASLILLASSVITTQPAGAVKCEGETVTLAVVAAGSGHTYQWKKNGQMLIDNAQITGSQQATLTLSDLSASNAGSYNCLLDGIENSIPALLYVNKTTAITSVSGAGGLCSNEAITLAVTANGDSLDYAWYKDGLALTDNAETTGSSSAIMGIQPVNPGHTGSYTCQVTGACGNAISDPQVITVSVPVNIDTQPSPVTVCEGQAANLSIAASGSNLTYQWYRNGTILTDDTRINGSHSQSLMITGTVPEDDGVYSCVVTGTCRTVYSTSAQIKVNKTVLIAQQPNHASRCVNDFITFIVTTNMIGLNYQWQKDGVSLVDNATVSGSGSGVLRISNLQLSDGGAYQCIITGSCNTVTSSPANLTIYNSPLITAQPVNGFICTGESHSFAITATGSSLSYQWMKDGLVLSETSPYTGTTSPTLQINVATPDESGVYHCVVTGNCLSAVSTPAVLTVNILVAITSQPESKQLCAGNDLTLVTVAAGTDNTYQWIKDGAPLTDGGNLSGATKPLLNITSITQAESGVYQCMVTGVCNSIASQPAEVIISTAPVLTLHPLGTTVCEGTNVLLHTSVTGSNPVYSWKHNGIALADTGNISGSQTADLLIQNITPASAGIYTCEVNNSCGSVNSSPATVAVNQKGVLITQPRSTQRCLGEQVSLFVNASGNNLSYQWEFEGFALVDGGKISGTQSRVLTISNSGLAENGAYRCVITDGCGTVINSEPAILTIHEPVAITGISAGDTICAGQSAVITVSASGSNLEFQWFRNGTILTDGSGLSGANTPSLIIENITPDKSGYYSCQVSGSCGNVITAAVPVLVNLLVQITDHPDNLTLCTGEMAIFSISALGDSLRFQWMKDGNPLSDGSGIDGANASKLLVTNVESSDAGSYHCLVTGACGSMISQPAMLAVNGYPGTAGVITGEGVVCQGTIGVIYMVAAIPDADYYKWTLPPGVVITSGQNSRQIEVTFTEHESGGALSVSGMNVCGSGPSSPLLNVVANPLPVTYAGENTGVCSDNATLFAYTPANPATGLWQTINGPAVIDQPTQSTTTVSFLRNGANNFAWTVTLNGCVVTDTVTIHNNRLIVEAGKDTSICDHMYTFGAVSPITGTGEWSIISGAGYNISRYDPQSLVSGLAQGTNKFKWSVNNNGCVSYDTVKITNNLPTESEAGVNQHIQSDNTNLNANNPTIGTGEWSLLNGSGTIDNHHAYNTLVTGLGKGSNLFAWMITHTGCVSTDTVVVENILTDTTDAGSNQIICSSSVRLNARNPYPGYGEWSVKRGSATFINNGVYNTTAYNLAQGENVLVWTAYLNGVTSDSVIFINNLPTTANAGVNLSTCEDTTRLNANLPYIGTGLWSIVSGSGTFVDNSSNTTTVFNLARGNNNFKWTITNGTCTSSSIVSFTKNKPSDAEAGFDAVTCEDSIVLSPNVPTFGVGEWSVFSGSATFAGNIALNLGRDDNLLIYSIRNAGCYSRDTLMITSHKPTTAMLGADQSVCQDSVLMIANAPVTGTGLWSLQSGSGSIDNVTNASTLVKNLGAGQNTLRWAISYLECHSYDDIVISNDFVTALAGPDKVMCSDRTTLEGNNPGLSQGVWTVIGGTTGADILDPHAPNSVIENLAKGNNILRWTISKNSCTSYDEVILTNNTPTAAFAGENMYLCIDEVELRANTIIQGQGTWSTLSGSGTFSDMHSATARFSNMGSGSNVLRWTSENDGCVTTDEVIISNNLPVNVYAGLDQTLCYDSTVLYANPPSLGVGVWSVIQGSALFTNPQQYNSSVSQLGNGSNRLKWTVATTGCSASDTVVITNNLPTVAVAGSDFPVCNSMGNMNANTPRFGTGEWSLISGAGNIANAGLPRTSITGLALGNNLLRWTISKENCSSSDDLLIVNNSPTIAEAGEDAEVCGETAILFANSPVVGFGYWTVMSGTGDFTDSLNYNTTINGLTFGENTLRWTTRNGSCLTIDEITVTNNLAYVYAGEDKVTYVSTATLTGNNPGSGTGEWLLIAGAGSIEAPNDFTTPVASLGAGLNTFEWTINNGSCTARDQVILHYKVMPRVGFTASQIEGCPGTTVDLVNTTQYGTTYKWEMGDGTTTTEVNPSHTYNFAGVYNVKLTAYGPDNRFVSSDTTITVHSNPVASFYFKPDTAFVNKPMRCYNDDSYNASTFLWDFGDNTVSNEKNPIHSYSESSHYTITLTVTSDFGCIDTTSLSIFVAEDGLIIFPNAFTPNPNGSNGGVYDESDRSNDVFHPYHENVAEFNMEIYSRWGMLLFETDDINIGWDGYYKGELLAKDVYVWKANGKYVSGSGFIKTGTVLLIK